MWKPCPWSRSSNSSTSSCVHPDSLTIEATGADGKLEALLKLLKPFGIVELVRSGAVAVTRGPKALSEKVLGSQITDR